MEMHLIRSHSVYLVHTNDVITLMLVNTVKFKLAPTLYNSLFKFHWSSSTTGASETVPVVPGSGNTVEKLL